MTATQQTDTDCTWRCSRCGEKQTQPPSAAQVYHPCGEKRVLRPMKKEAA